MPSWAGAQTISGAACALVVGVSDFADSEYAERPVPHAVSDANGLADTLTHRLGWDLGHIKLLTGSVSKSDIVTAFHQIRNQASASREGVHTSRQRWIGVTF